MKLGQDKMPKFRYIECQNCGTIHYIISKEDALLWEAQATAEFSKRNLEHCAGCGMKTKFVSISESEVASYSNSEIPPVYLGDESTLGKPTTNS
jgi:hypothetical protein